MSSDPVLRVGETKNIAAIRRLQDLLRANGFWSTKATIDRYTPEMAAEVSYFQQTHLGPDRRPLDVDAVVGGDTWWALEHSTGDSQRSFITATIPDGVSGLRRRVLEVALSQHGVKEEPNGSNRGPGVDQYLPEFMLKQAGQGPAWCCFFFSWVSRKANDGSYPMGQRIGSCVEVSKVAQAKGFWHPNDGKYVPRPGDAFVMLYKGEREGHGHIGYVLRVDPKTGQFNTCEGNCGNRVKVGLRDYDDDPRIAGFINFYGDANEALSFQTGIIEASGVASETTT